MAEPTVRPQHCPVCESADLEWTEYPEDQAGARLVCPCTCLHCFATWEDVYVFVERRNLKADL